ncbi:hypothetical protein HCN44_004660 [Aphidius gifuensis]|uniref:Uncharacterized protein n=1 Tax=Aphidius gifuensis TaxID=684658 RepID=A0A834XX94_APHGI|nr:hypothetical protein HCN44_004660 [Aphidius gifuensis]
MWWKESVILVLCCLTFVLTQDDESERRDFPGQCVSTESVDKDLNNVYQGKCIGKFNSYHHQVSGEVYAVDEYTLLLKNFNYDGTSIDAFFWAGTSNRRGSQGFIVPDEWGKTNVLERYLNKDFILTLPDKKKITEIKGFEPPKPQKIGQLSKRGDHRVDSETITIVDSKTIRITGFKFDGRDSNTYFWVGLGPQPSAKGFKVPDEHGYLDSLREYKGEEISIELPGDMTVFSIDWLSIYNIETKTNYGSISIQNDLNVPPSLVKIIKHKRTLPNCEQLHKIYQVSWEIFGPQITFQLSAQVSNNEYMAFGISGSSEKSQMEGADVTIAYMDGARGFANDYNITAKAPCAKTLGQYKGVCKDELVGGQDSNQIFTAFQKDGLQVITYRRTLISSDPVYFIWAIGKLDENKEPNFHDIYSRSDLKLNLNRTESSDISYVVVRILIGANGLIEFTRRGRPRPTVVGPLCLSKHDGRDRRLDDDFPTFKKFNNTLIHVCESGEGGNLEVTPNSSWPDTVYYNSFTHANVGWKIHVVDAYIKPKPSNAINIIINNNIIIITILLLSYYI